MYDVVVVGARCAGAATARLLAGMGHDVLMVDKTRLPSDTLSTHGLIRGGVVQLSRWGLLDRVLDSGAPAITQVRFDIEGESKVRRIKQRAGVDMLVAPRRHVLDGLLADAAEEAGARAPDRGDRDRSAAVGRRTGQPASSAVPRTGDRVELPARMVVGADGRGSRMAGYFGARDAGAVHLTVCGLLHVCDRSPPGHATSSTSHRTRSPVSSRRNDGEACVWLIRPTPLLEPIRTAGTARTAAFVEQLELLVPDLGHRVRAGRITARLRGTGESAELPSPDPTARDGRSSATPATTGTRSPGTASPTRSGTRNCWRPPSTAASTTRRSSGPR